MAKRINVVCATTPGPNPGMASVDLGFRAFARRHAPTAELVFHQLYTTAELMATQPKPAPEAQRARELARQALPFDYVCSRDRPEPLWDADALVYWGDFLHMEHYQRTVASRLKRIGAAVDEAEGRAKGLDYFFLRRAPDAALARTVAFGGTLIFDRGPESCGVDYAEAFSRFMKGARGAWMRDSFSAQKVARERGTLAAPDLGCDAALLLDAAGAAELPRTAWTADPALGRGGVGLFFGRSAMKLEVLAGFGAEVAQRLGAKPHWIPWGTQHSFPMMRYTVRSPDDAPAPDVEPTLGDLLEFVSRYRLVVSDTYHLCVTAWKCGVPAICIGQALPRTLNNVNSGWAFAWRDKRQTFYAMHDALDYYVYAEELGHPDIRAARLESLMGSVADRTMVEGVTQRVRAQAAAAEAALAASLKGLL